MKLLKTLIISFFLINTAIVFGQDQLEQLELLESLFSNNQSARGGGAPISSNSTDYRSFTQFEYENTVNNINKIDESSDLERFREQLRERKIDLAIKLCQEDENACYLIDEYRKISPQLTDNQLKLDDLTLFGVDYFISYPLTFDQSSFKGAPKNYKLRPGDVLLLNTYGSSNATYELKINLDGSLDLPGIGQVNVGGLIIDEAKDLVSSFAENKILGISTTLSISSTSPIQIYALGMVQNPGSYKLSAISKSVNAVIASGGFKNSASLRSIQVKREDEIVSEIDLYDLLIFGNSSKDIHLEEDDVILVKPLQHSVSIYGAVNSPHIYEIQENDTVKNVINYAQGLSTNADKLNIVVKRKNQFGQLLTLKLEDVNSTELQNGDIIYVPSQETEDNRSVHLYGAVKSPGARAYVTQSKLSDYINLEYDLLDTSYPAFGVIVRRNFDTRSTEIIEFDLLGNSSNLQINEGDDIYIFDYYDIRALNSLSLKSALSIRGNNEFIGKRQLDLNQENYEVNLINSLDLSEINQDEMINFSNIASENDCFNNVQYFSNEDFIKNSLLKYSLFSYLPESKCTDFLSTHTELIPILLNRSIPVFGSIRNPGLYPVTTNVTASQLINMAGGTAKSRNAILNFDIGSYSTVRNTDLMSVSNLKYISARDDNLSTNNKFVKIYGEVKFPGTYEIDSTTTLLDLYKKAGGLLPKAYAEAGILSRESIKDREQSALRKAESELADILASAVASGVISQSSTDIMTLVSMMNQLSNATPIGRLITEMNQTELENYPEKDIFLQSGDSIYIPERNNVITIYGSVLNPTTVPFNPKLDIEDYVKLAGGFKDYADENKVYVLLPNGKAIKPSGSFFRKGASILPGSTVIVPREARPLSGLSLVEAISPVLANLSISLASINSITDNN